MSGAMVVWCQHPAVHWMQVGFHVSNHNQTRSRAASTNEGVGRGQPSSAIVANSISCMLWLSTKPQYKARACS